LTIRKYEKINKNLTSFYIFGYLLELRIESGEFQIFFPQIWRLENSKNTHFRHFVKQFAKNKKTLASPTSESVVVRNPIAPRHPRERGNS